MKNNKLIYITQTAVMLALLLGVQFATRSFSQFVTGAMVNLILLVSVFAIGFGGGLTIAIASPFLAFLAGIGPAFIQIVPFIAVGNAIFVSLAWTVRKRVTRFGAKDIGLAAGGLIMASAAKFLFLWIGLAVAALPLIPGIQEKQIEIIGAAFTWPQLVTALTGSALAMVIVPLLKKAIKQ